MQHEAGARAPCGRPRRRHTATGIATVDSTPSTSQAHGEEDRPRAATPGGERAWKLLGDREDEQSNEDAGRGRRRTQARRRRPLARESRTLSGMPRTNSRRDIGTEDSQRQRAAIGGRDRGRATAGAGRRGDVRGSGWHRAPRDVDRGDPRSRRGAVIERERPGPRRERLKGKLTLDERTSPAWPRRRNGSADQDAPTPERDARRAGRCPSASKVDRRLRATKPATSRGVPERSNSPAPSGRRPQQEDRSRGNCVARPPPSGRGGAAPTAMTAATSGTAMLAKSSDATQQSTPADVAALRRTVVDRRRRGPRGSGRRRRV